MQVGVAFPRDGLKNDSAAMRDFAQAAESLGYTHISIGDHVIGRAGLQDTGRPIIDAFVLFSHLGAVTSRIRFVFGVMPVPQRQTVLVAKQAASVDVLTGGRLGLGFSVGWDELEYQALNENFHNRGRRMDEQIEVMRLLWTQPVVDFKGHYHTIDHAGINPLPIQRPIPIWIAGYAEAVLRRVARLADGWMPQAPPGFPPGAGPELVAPTLAKLRGYVSEAGRNPADLELIGTLPMMNNTPDGWRRRLDGWHELAATHITVNAATDSEPTIEKYLQALRLFHEEILAHA
jgi:probable F420-dependent oxidoreductase